MLLRTFVCCVIFLGLKITHVHARGVLTIRLLNFENKKGRTYDGSCCDQTPLADATCPDQCDYVMRLIVSGLGRANDHVFLFHRPLKYDANDISFQEESTDMVLTILFDEWPKMGHVKMNAFFYDYDDYDHTTLLVDWFENELKRTVNKGNYQRGTVKGNRQADKTTLEFEWSVHCFTKDDCLKPPPEWKSWPWDRKEDQTHPDWSTPKPTSDRPPTTSMDMSNDVIAHKWSDKGWEMSSVAPQGATNDDTPAVVSNINAKDHSSNKITGKTKNKVTGARDSYKPRKSLSPYGKPTYPKRRPHQSSKAKYRRPDDRNVLGKNDIVPVAGSSITQKHKEGDVRTTNLRSKNKFHGNSPFSKHGASNPVHNTESKTPSGLRYFSGNADETIEKPTAPYQDGQKGEQVTLSETKTKTFHQSNAPSVKPGEDRTSSRDVMNPYTKPKSKTSDQNRRQMKKTLGHSTSYPSTVRHNKNYTPATRKQNTHSKIDGRKSTSFRQSNGDNGRKSASTTKSMKNQDRGVLTTQPSVGSRRIGNRRGKYGGTLKNRYQLVNQVTEISTHRTQTEFVSYQERKETSKKPSTTKHSPNPAGVGKDKRQPFRSWSRAKETTSTPYTRGQGSRARSSSSTSFPRQINQQTMSVTVRPTEKMQKETSTKNTWSGRYTTEVSKIINDKRNMNSPFKPTKSTFGTDEDDNENIIATSDRKTDGVKFTKTQETTNNAPMNPPVSDPNQSKKPTSQKSPFHPGQTTKDRSLQNNMIKNLKTAIRDNMRKFVSAITPTPGNSQSKTSADFTNQTPKESSNAHKTYREKADSPDHATESTTHSGPRWTHFTRWWERPQTTPALPTLKVIPAGVNEGKVYDIVDGYKRRKQNANHRSPYKKIENKSRVHDNSGSTRRQGKSGQRRTNQVTLPTHATIRTTKQTSSAPITRSNVQKSWKPKQKKLPYTKPAGRTTSTPRATITQQRKTHVITEDSEETGNILLNNKINKKPTIKTNIALTSREPSFRKSTRKNNLHTTESTKRVIKERTRSWRRPLRTTLPSLESTQKSSVRGMKGTRRSWIQQSTSPATSNQVIKRQRHVTQQHLNPVTKQHQKPVTRPNVKPVTKQNQKPVTKQQGPVTKQHQRPITKYDQEVVTKLYQKTVTKHQQRPVTKHYRIPATEDYQRPETRATQQPGWGRKYPKSSKSPPLHTTQVTPSGPRTTRKWKRITGGRNMNGFKTTNIWQGLMSTRIITTGRTIDYGPQATKPTPFQKKHLPTLKKWNDRQNMKQETLQKSKAHERNRNRKQNSGRTISSTQAPVRRDEQALDKATKRTPFTRPRSLGRDKSDMTKKTEITKNKPTRSWHRPTQKTQHIPTSKDEITISQVNRRKSDTGTTKSWQRPKNPTTRRSSNKNLQSHMSTPSRPAIVTMKPTRSWRRKTLTSTTETKAKFDSQMTTSSPTLVPLHIKPTKWWQRKKATLSSADLKKETTTRLQKVTIATKATAQPTRHWQRKNLPKTTENPTRVIEHKSAPSTYSATKKVITQTTKSWQRQKNTKTTVSARRYTNGRTTETSRYTTTVIPNVVTNKARPTKWWQRRKTATTSKQDIKRTTTISPKALTVKNEPTKWWNRKKADKLTSRFSNKQTTPATTSTTLNSKPTKRWNRRKGQITTTAPKLVTYQDNRKVSRVTTIRNRPTKWWQRRKNKPTTSNHEKGVQTTATPRRHVTLSVKPTKQWQRRKDHSTPVHVQKQTDNFSKSPLLPANRNIAQTKSWRRPNGPTTTTQTQKGHSKVAPSINSVTFSVRPTKWWQRRHTTTSIRDVDVVGTTLQTPYNVKVVNTGRPTKWWQRRTQPSKSLTTQSAVINRGKQDNKLATLSRPIPTRSWIRRTTGISTAYTTQGTVSTTIKRNIWNRNPMPDRRNPRRDGEHSATTKPQSYTTGKHVSSGTNPAISPKLQGDLKGEMHKTVTSSASTSDTTHIGTSDKSANGGKKGWNIFEFLPDVLSNMYNGKPVKEDDNNEEGVRLTSAAAGRSPSPRFNYATKGLKSTVKHDGRHVSSTKTTKKNFLETKRTSSTGSLPSSGRTDSTTPKTRHSYTTTRTVRTTPQSRKVSDRSRGTTMGSKHMLKVKPTAEATQKTLTTRKPTTVKQTTTRTTRPTKPATTKRATTMTTKRRTSPRKTTTTKPPKTTTKLTTILTTSSSKNNVKSTKSKKERSKKKESRSKAKKKKERVTTTTAATTKSKKKKNNAKSKATESNAKANDGKVKGVDLKKIFADFERNKKKNALKIGIDNKKDSKKKVNNKPKTQIDLKKSAINIDFKKPVKKTVKKVNSKTEKNVNSEKKVSSEKKVNSKTVNKLEPQPTVISVNSSSNGGPRVNVPNAGLFVPGPGRTKIVKILKSQKDENGTVHEEEVLVAIPSNSEAQHIGLQVKRLNIQTVFNRYWPAILGLTIGTAFLVAAVLTSVACRAQRLYIQRYRYNDQPQHLTEPPDTSEYSSSAASLVSDGTRSSIRL